MPKTNAISSIQKSQGFFSNNVFNSIKSDFFYVKNDRLSYDICEKNFFHLLNIPKIKDIDSYQHYPKLSAINNIEKDILIKKSDKKFSFAYNLAEDQYKLFIINTEFKIMDNQSKIVTHWSAFSRIYCREEYLAMLGFNEIEDPDSGYPIHLFKNTNPMSLCTSQDAWAVIWFFILGRSIRWIAEFLDMSKKNVETHLNDLYIDAGVMNKKNLMAIAYKFNWLDFINIKIINTINATLPQNKKIIF